MNRAAAPKSDPGAAQGVMGYGRLILLVVLPFAGGYFLSSFYRTITAVISAELSSSMDLRACWFPRARRLCGLAHAGWEGGGGLLTAL